MLRRLRIAEGDIERDDIETLLRDADLPIEQLERDFDFDALLQLLRVEGGEQGDATTDEIVEPFTQHADAQTDILALQRCNQEAS